MSSAKLLEPRPPTAGAATGGDDAKAAESLRRRLKQLETNHKDWQEQVQKELRRQKMELETLRRDNEQYKQQLNELRATEATTSSGAGSLRNPNSKGTKRSKELDAKRDTMAHLEMKIQSEEAKIRDLERQIEETRAVTKNARKSRHGVNATQEGYDMINRQVGVLENRLDQSLVKFNDVLRQNKELRDTIDTLRGERDVFEAIYQKLEAELQEKKKEMAFIIEVSNIAYEERDNNVQVLQNLKAFAAEEMNSFAETFKELDDLLEEDRRMKEQVKARIAQLEKKDKASGLGADDASGGRRRPQTAPSKGGASPSSELGARESQAQAQARAYEEAFMKIRQKTEIPDLQELVQRFIHAEEENFSLFSYVNDLSKEIEALENQRTHLLDDIEKMSVGDAEDRERRATLKKLEDQLRAEEGRNQTFIELSLRTEGILRGVMTTVEHIFSRLDCDDSAIIEQHGISGLTLENLLLYLASIELRTDEYLLAWSKQNGAIVEGFLGQRGPQVPFDTLQITVDPKRLPGTGEDAEGSDDDDHPLSPEELMRKVKAKMSTQAISAADRRNVRGAKTKIGTVGLKK